jgi:hypothetical protein
MHRAYTFGALERLKRWHFRRWCELLRFGETPEAEEARQRYTAFVDLSNAWLR